MATQKPKKPELPAGRYDIVSKEMIQQNPEDWLRFTLGIPNAKFIKVIETEQLTVKSNRADIFMEAEVDGEEIIVHLEIQTRDSTKIPMPYRVAGYAGRGLERFRKDVCSHVIYLHEKAGLNDPGEYRQDRFGYEILIRYKVIRLCELEGQAVLDAKLKGIMPFTPLMKPPTGLGDEAWLSRCVEAAESLPQGASERADYLGCLGVLSGLKFDWDTIHKFISEATMYESSVVRHFFQQGIEQGIEQGARDSIIEGILEALDVRFNSSVAKTLQPTLESIEELQRLKDLRREAFHAQSIEAFAQTLAASSNGTEPSKNGDAAE